MTFFTEISGVRIKDIDIDEFRRTMDRYAVCVIRNEKPVADAEHVEFSRRLGPLLPMKMLTMVGKSKSRFAHPELIDIGNIDAEGRLLPEDDRRRAYNRGNLLWHTDASYDQARGVYSLLSCHSIPPGGADTEFADMRMAYEALPGKRREEIDNLLVEHSVWHSRALAGMTDVSEAEKATRPPARHRLVHTHPGSRR
jgi:alpha-ketoglutarate-dependent 2,4-dichlorophenoxyacetate dioxygenase